jgi:hypothetical protein
MRIGSLVKSIGTLLVLAACAGSAVGDSDPAGAAAADKKDWKVQLNSHTRARVFKDKKKPVKVKFDGKKGESVTVDVVTAAVKNTKTKDFDFDPAPSVSISFKNKKLTDVHEQTFEGKAGTANGGHQLRLLLPDAGTYTITYTGKEGSSYFLDLRGFVPCDPKQEGGVRHNKACARGERCLEGTCEAATKNGDPCSGAWNGPDSEHGDDECVAGTVCTFDEDISKGDEGWDGYCKPGTADPR